MVEEAEELDVQVMEARKMKEEETLEVGHN